MTNDFFIVVKWLDETMVGLANKVKGRGLGWPHPQSRGPRRRGDSPPFASLRRPRGKGAAVAASTEDKTEDASVEGGPGTGHAHFGAPGELR